MATTTATDIEPCCERFRPAETSAVPFVFDQMSHDSPKWSLPTSADAILGVPATGEGA